MGEIVLGRIGHYYDPGSGACSAALVTHVYSAPGEGPETGAGAPIILVNLRVWQSDAEDQRRLSVPVAGDQPREGMATFHLNRDCPWGR
jgi:hypothetical protein